jgi:hypothetical protein
VGDVENAIGLSVCPEGITVWKRQDKKDEVLGKADKPHAAVLHLRMTVRGGHELQFAISNDGKAYTEVGGVVDGAKFLTPWDRSVRIAIFSGGSDKAAAVFRSLSVINEGRSKSSAQ